MPDTTNGLPYPAVTDPVADGAGVIQDLATELDALIFGAIGGVTAGTNMTVPASAVVRRGRSCHLLVNAWTSTGVIASGAVIGTIAAGFRPSQLWQGHVVEGTTIHGIEINTDGTIELTPGIGSGVALYGSVTYPI